ncbi:membrane-spanning 4-domains subfamily A member 4A-like isoform X2 [Watersipora subatra]
MQQQPAQQPQQMLGQQQQVIQPNQPVQDTQFGVTIVTQNPQESFYKLKPIALSQLKGLSITQIVVGALCLPFAFSLLPVEAESNYSSKLSFTGYGIWCGVYFVLAGGIGLGAVKHNTKPWINATMILNIFSSAIFFPVLISMASIVVGGNTFSSYCKRYSSACPSEETSTALNCVLLLFSVAELMIAIWIAVLCCEAICNCCLPVRPNHQVQYAAPVLQTQQQYAVYPGTVSTQHVNLSGYQVTTEHQTPTATTLMLPQAGYIAQSQQPPAYYQIVQATPNQISGNDQLPSSADV